MRSSCRFQIVNLYFVFNSMFELKVILPLQKDLCVRVKDYDLICSDEIIGETWIDLDNRFMTKHRATCGLPKVYYEYV